MSSNTNDLTPKSVLYWLSAALAIGIMSFGLLALVAPQFGSVIFGIPVTGAEALPWVRLAAIRDIALGLFLIAVLALKQGRTAGILILLAIVVPVTDATTVFLRNGPDYHILIHGASILFMLFLGARLLRCP
jgi:hypothetical protein